MFKKVLLISLGLSTAVPSFAMSGMDVYIQEYSKVLAEDLSSIVKKDVQIEADEGLLDNMLHSRQNQDFTQTVRVDIQNASCLDYLTVLVYMEKASEIEGGMRDLKDERSRIPKVATLVAAIGNVYNKLNVMGSIRKKECMNDMSKFKDNPTLGINPVSEKIKEKYNAEIQELKKLGVWKAPEEKQNNSK